MLSVLIYFLFYFMVFFSPGVFIYIFQFLFNDTFLFSCMSFLSTKICVPWVLFLYILLLLGILGGKISNGWMSDPYLQFGFVTDRLR